MRYTDETFMKRGDPVMLRGVSSFTVKESAYSTREYKSRFLSFMENGTLRLALPEEYGDVVTLSLDRIYEIAIQTDEDTFRGRGRILSRFCGEDGNVCIFKLSGAFSKDPKRKYEQIDVRIPARYETGPNKDTGEGMITSFAMERLVMETGRFLEEKEPIRLRLKEDSLGEITLEGMIRESLKIRNDAYESDIALKSPSEDVQERLAKWSLEKARAISL